MAGEGTTGVTKVGTTGVTEGATDGVTLPGGSSRSGKKSSD